ncbi:MAG TPA: glycosyltransferase [Lapillicoccus sp.]|nr:glycosyltransferase [Lapillicoccus sp.]
MASLEAWDGVWRRNQHLVSRLLRDDPCLRVLFVEPPADPIHAARRRERPRPGQGLRLGPTLDGVPAGRLYLYQGTKALPRRVDPHVDQRLAEQVVRAADQLGFDDPLLWVNDPAAATLMARTGWRTLYDITDDWLHSGHTDQEHARLLEDEGRLLRDAAQVVVCSPALLAGKTEPRAGRPLTLVPNAVDVDAYRSPGPRPADLPDGPVALYVGTVHRDRVDLDLTARTARELAGRATLVLVGPAPLDPAERHVLEGAGVVLLGPREAATVPAYLCAADVLLVPHVVTPFTDSLDPIKLYEYRAANRPVVSTRVAGFRESDDPRVALADPEDFPAAVAAALDDTSGTTRGRRKAPPETPSWDLRAATMRSVLEDVAASRPSRDRPTIAIAHDYLTQRGGAERVVLAMHRAFPDATIYTTLYEPESTYPEFRNARIVTSALNDITPLRHHHRTALPLLPFAARSIRISEDVVLASSSGWAHGFSATGRRLVYCHAPARWLYQAEAYLGGGHRQSLRGVALLAMTPWLKRWDKRHALAADGHLANSRVVRDRMRDAYGIEAPVLPAPHAMDPGAAQEPVPELAGWSDYHLVVSRLLPYKNVDAAVEAFRDLPERLVVVGHGPLKRSLERHLPANVRLLSNLTDAQLRWVYAHSRALVAPSLEDYGLTPLEAAAYGKPTLALGAGGYLDTVVPGTTGLFFDHPTPRDIRAAVLSARERDWSESTIREHAERFSEPAFHAALYRAVEELSEPRPVAVGR